MPICGHTDVNIGAHVPVYGVGMGIRTVYFLRHQAFTIFKMFLI